MASQRRMRPVLGTFVEIGAEDAPDSAVASAFGELDRAQARWSFHDPDSDLSRLNRAPGERVAVHHGTLRLLALAKGIAARSGGLFDPTVGGELVRRGVLPDHGGPVPLARGDHTDIELGDGWARLRRPVRITLDGIAKGWAVDRAIGALRRLGASGGWVNAGGDLRVFGTASLQMQLRQLDGSLRTFGTLRNGALASSRVGPFDPDFPTLLLAPGGDAAHAGIWSVLATSAARADALTKVAAACAEDARAATVAALGGHLARQPATASAGVAA
jgi:thiamine biosynthesis lipoprotein